MRLSFSVQHSFAKKGPRNWAHKSIGQLRHYIWNQMSALRWQSPLSQNPYMRENASINQHRSWVTSPTSVHLIYRIMRSHGQTNSSKRRLKWSKRKKRYPNLRKRRLMPVAWKLKLYSKICFLAGIVIILGIVDQICVRKRLALVLMSIPIAKWTPTVV